MLSRKGKNKEFMKKLKSSICFIFLLSSIVFSQQPDFQKERQFFDFLIGKWTIKSAETATGKWESDGKEKFKFSKALDCKVLVSEWYFNRGIPAKPNFTNALYYMGFDNASQSWTFYYLSPMSAQFYQGKFESDNWYFYKTFNLNGKTVIERQNWLLIDNGLVQRTIENSEDEGKTWSKIYRAILKPA